MHLKRFYPPEDKEPADEEPPTPAMQSGQRRTVHFQTPRYHGKYNLILAYNCV